MTEEQLERKRQRNRKYYQRNREHLLKRNRERSRRWYQVNREKQLVKFKQWYAENREKSVERVRSWQAEHPERTREFKRRWDAENPERRREARNKWEMAHPDNARARHINCCFGKRAATLSDLLWDFQKGRDYITDEPLVDGFCLDHCHDSDLVRGLVNETTNRILGQHCGDSITGCRQRLAKLKNKKGRLAQFIPKAIHGLMNTPTRQMELEFRLTGRRASLPESRTNRHIIERANMLAIDAYMSTERNLKLCVIQ
jgi:hypothetical protein